MLERYLNESTIVYLIALIGAAFMSLIFQVLRLYRKELYQIQRQALFSSELFEQLKLFAEAQLESLRDNYGGYAFYGDEMKEKIVSYYLIGAAEFLGKQHGLDAKSRRVLTVKLLDYNLGLRAREVSNLYVGAKRVKSASKNNPIHVGAKGLKKWMQNANENSAFALNTLLV